MEWYLEAPISSEDLSFSLESGLRGAAYQTQSIEAKCGG